MDYGDNVVANHRKGKVQLEGQQREPFTCSVTVKDDHGQVIKPTTFLAKTKRLNEVDANLLQESKDDQQSFLNHSLTQDIVLTTPPSHSALGSISLSIGGLLSIARDGLDDWRRATQKHISCSFLNALSGPPLPSWAWVKGVPSLLVAARSTLKVSPDLHVTRVMLTWRPCVATSHEAFETQWTSTFHHGQCRESRPKYES